MQQSCDQTSQESELFYRVLHPLRVLTTNKSQSPVFLAKFSSTVRMRKRKEPGLLSKSGIWWLADQKDSHKCVRWTENVFFSQAVKLSFTLRLL